MIYKKFLSKEYKEIYIIIIIILIIRIFIIESFRIPSASMQPTLLIGDFIFVNKFIYGIKIPIIKINININNPKKGDLIVFKKNNVNYIKRLIGKENDEIIYKNKKIYINKNKIKTKKKGYEKKIIKKEALIIKIEILKEYLNPKKEYIIKNNLKDMNQKYNYENVKVPKNSFFFLGDNRDNSNDSRFWGFIENNKIIGKAVIIWFSINIKEINIRWDRILKYLK